MQKDNMFTSKQQNHLLALARKSLNHYFTTGDVLFIDESLVDADLTQKRGTFVTLTKNGELRGCIGHIEPAQEIYKDIIENALSAGLEDNRFVPVRQEELSELKIEISILTEPEKLIYNSPEDLLNKLRPLVDGVIIEKGRQGATYLPQVWEGWEGKNVKAEFLSSLCQKAGLPEDEWRTGSLKVCIYQAEVFGKK
ncbi:MAG TPA: AmmeMemoRadiSam system protein A [Candidatus Magasanikbacteria bacterium]|nr:AmmeMemoRadiSam system protein A [Candidatus Magasanikbacteria bacterium]